VAIAFCDPAERGYLRDIERLIRRRLTVIGEEPAAPQSNGRDQAKTPGGEQRHNRGKPRGGRNRKRSSNRGSAGKRAA
jgi:ATP-dependent RNA helicase RhlE